MCDFMCSGVSMGRVRGLRPPTLLIVTPNSMKSRMRGLFFVTSVSGDWPFLRPRFFGRPFFGTVFSADFFLKLVFFVPRPGFFETFSFAHSPSGDLPRALMLALQGAPYRPFVAS